MRTKITIAEQHANFLRFAYCGLVLRGYDRERDIPDPILRHVWRYGKRLQAPHGPKKRRRAPAQPAQQ